MSRRLVCLIVCFFLLVIAPAGAHARLAVRSAILLNVNSGRILYEMNADQAIPPASLTKVLSMYIALDTIKKKRINAKNPVRISASAAATGGSRMHLKAGERLSLDALLTGMAVASGNDASVAVAQRIATSSRSFVQLMNKKAKDLGMRNSVFKTPHGLPAKGQITTARDMLTLARAYLKTHPDALRYHRTSAIKHRGRIMGNTNALLGTVRGVDGLKTGWIAASGYNLIFTAQRGNTRLLGVVMGGVTKNARDDAARRLLEAGFATPADARKVSRRMDKRR